MKIIFEQTTMTWIADNSESVQTVSWIQYNRNFGQEARTFKTTNFALAFDMSVIIF